MSVVESVAAASAGTRPKRHRQRKAAYHAIAHVELYEPDQFSCGSVKLLQGIVVPLPIQDQMRRQNAATRDGSDVRHLRQDVCFPKKADHAQVKERGAEATP